MEKLTNYDHNKRKSLNIRYSDEDFLKWYNEGLNDTEISKKMNCNHVTIHNKRIKLKLPANFKYINKTDLKIDFTKFYELYEEGKNDKEIGSYFGVNSRRIEERRKLLKLPTKFTSNIRTTEGDLTYEEEQVLLGTVLGDTHLKKRTEKSGTGGMFAHCLKQKDYAYWKYEKLKRFCLKEPIFREQFHKVHNKIYYKTIVNFRVDKIFDKYHHLFYTNKVKEIKQDLLDKLEPLALAVWFMDDGSKSTSGGYTFATNCFSEEDLNKVINHFKRKWNLNCSIHSNRKNRRILYINKESGFIFKSLIEPYVHNTMLYKLHI